MTLAELIAEIRVQADDKAAGQLWEDEWLIQCLNEAQEEAVIRSRLLHESANAAVCEIAVAAGQTVYALHPALYEIDYLGFLPTGSTCRQPVSLKSREAMDALDPDWRGKTGCVEYAIQSDNTLRLVYVPETAGTLYLEGYRLPLKAMVNEGDKPELHRAHHIHLVQWVLHKAFSIPDADMFDAGRAREAKDKFAEYFGERPDADLRRATQEDVPHTVKAFLP